VLQALIMETANYDKIVMRYLKRQKMVTTDVFRHELRKTNASGTGADIIYQNDPYQSSAAHSHQ